MTLNQIEGRWWSYRTREERRDLWERLTGPERGWFQACRHAVETGNTLTVQAWLNEAGTGKRPIVYFHQEAADMVRAHLLCALAALQHGHWPTHTVPDEGLRRIADSLGMALGFLRDLTQELLRGQLHRAARRQALTALLVDTEYDRGVVATLTLELMPDGTGALYPIPALAFVERDEEFREAEAEASNYARHNGLWQDRWDVRWGLERRDGMPLTRLTGPSMGGAFALGLARLFAGE